MCLGAQKLGPLSPARTAERSEDAEENWRWDGGCSGRAYLVAGGKVQVALSFF